MAEPMLLGLADEKISDNEDSLCGWSVNKFGGRTNWMHGPPDSHPTCFLCGQLLPLVTQIYCPMQNSPYHRVLYMFACANPECWNSSESWKVLRSQAIDYSGHQQLQNKGQEDGFGTDDWGDDAEDWGDGATTDIDSVMSELASAAGKMTITSEAQPLSAKHVTMATETPPDPKIPSFTPYYVNVFEDESSSVNRKPVLSIHEKRLLMEYQQSETVDLSSWLEGDVSKIYEQLGSKDGMVSATEKYEETEVHHGDKVFHKFHKQLKSCPQQCLRYQWNGTPIFISTTAEAAWTKTTGIPYPPPCQYCGSPRVFELQLMPALVSKLRGPGSGFKLKGLGLPTELDKKTKEPHSSQLDEEHSIASAAENSSKSSNVLTSSDVDARSPLNLESKLIDNSKTVVNGNPPGSDPFDKETVAAPGGVKTVTIEGAHAGYTDVELNPGPVCGAREIQCIGVEFGTVLVYSCSKSCWDDSALYRDEALIVEPDPDATRLSKIQTER